MKFWRILSIKIPDGNVMNLGKAGGWRDRVLVPCGSGQNCPNARGVGHIA